MGQLPGMDVEKEKLMKERKRGKRETRRPRAGWGREISWY
jgi:hypothetical protein